MNKTLAFALVVVPALALAQGGRRRANDAPTQPPTPPPQETVSSDGPAWQLLKNLTPRQLGPTNMGGRIMGIAVYEKDPRIFYVASASGGLFKTTNGGITFKPVFEREGSISIGAVAVSATNPDIVWVGTGEASSRNSVAWGDGVYKSTDGGVTWKNMGLKDSMHIGKILIDPRNPDVVYVGALGHLWGSNPERGVYKSTDGGKSWDHALYVDDKTGVIDLEMNPDNNREIFAAMWQRMRKPYDFISGGSGSGLFKSSDSGRTWRRITKGLPNTNFGRIGLSYFRKNPKIIVGTFEYKPDRKAEEAEKPPAKRPSDGGEVKNYAGGTYKSTDGGESWKRINFLNPRPFYFSMPEQDPVDENRLYILGDNLWVSNDAGKTFRTMNIRVHPDHHAFWIDPLDDNHILDGNDGGAFVTRDKGVAWEQLNQLPIGQFYAVAVDMRRPYWIYGGLQDNSCWGIPTQTRHGGIAFFDSYGLGGGDGFHCQVDPTDWTTVYSESQGGSISRTDLSTGQSRGIRPRLQGQRVRFNWSTPFIISPHNPRTLYMGGNILFKTVDRGDHWVPISKDLSTNDPSKQHAGDLSVTPENTGAETHCTIITISESPMSEGLIWVGTDDGQVSVTRNGGATWTNVTLAIPGLPKNTWCSRVLASKWAEGRAYATFDGHRENDFKPYLYVTEDYGKTWKSLAGSLPDNDSLYVVTEGEKNRDLLYLGSEMSLRISLDTGKSWTRFRTKFPTVAVHDLLVHPRELDLVIGTHGRSIWTLDVSGLEQLDSDAMAKDVVVPTPQDVLLMPRNGGGEWEGDRYYVAPNTQPGTRVMYYLKKPAKDVTVIVSDIKGERTQEYTGSGDPGLNQVIWSGRLDGRMVVAGDYKITVKVDGKEYLGSVHAEDVSHRAE
ncbi:MAG: FlgD immunoglobulin-like domain containing protein [Fimbriimonas sp.]|nr:FlgD immunoglobulin-like domain containing protein [Fimbriimonas sp.]